MPVSHPMSSPGSSPPARFSRPFSSIAVAALTLLSLVYLVLQVGFPQPYFWPAGAGFRLQGDSRFAGIAGESAFHIARPPDVDERARGVTLVRDLVRTGPADTAGVSVGDEILQERFVSTGTVVSLPEVAIAGRIERLRIWRDAYWAGLRGPVSVDIRGPGPKDTAGRTVEIDRPAAWSSGSTIASLWAQRHLGMAAQIVVFIGAS